MDTAYGNTMAGRRAVSIFSRRRASFYDLQPEEWFVSRRGFSVWIRRIDPVVMAVNPLLQFRPVSRVVTKITHSVFDGAPFKDHNIIGPVLLEGRAMLVWPNTSS